MDDSRNVQLNVRDEHGKVHSAVVTSTEVSSLPRLRASLSYTGLTFETAFTLGYEHPEYGAYLIVRIVSEFDSEPRSKISNFNHTELLQISSEEDLQEWKDANFPELRIEPAPGEEIMTKVTSFFSSIFGRKSSSRTKLDDPLATKERPPPLAQQMDDRDDGL